MLLEEYCSQPLIAQKAGDVASPNINNNFSSAYSTTMSKIPFCSQSISNKGGKHTMNSKFDKVLPKVATSSRTYAMLSNTESQELNSGSDLLPNEETCRQKGQQNIASRNRTTDVTRKLPTTTLKRAPAMMPRSSQIFSSMMQATMDSKLSAMTNEELSNE